MNFIFISPNFPDCYFHFVESLNKRGIRVLGIGDAPYSSLNDSLKANLTEYMQVHDMSVYSNMLDVCRYYEKNYGPIDYLESNNEWWLQEDAKLRKDMMVENGFLPGDMLKIKAKSAMKACFQDAGVKTMRYILVNGPEDLAKAKEFASKVGWPLFVKPNVGVGATDSFKLEDEQAMERFLAKRLGETYIMEEYIEGTIVSYDGICDNDSNVVFSTTDIFDTPTAEMVQNNEDDCYYNNPISLPSELFDTKEFDEMGRKVIKSFGIKKRFFHIEFFVTKDGIYGLECNMRPAGGNTPDLINFANSLSCYEIYADVIAYNENRQDMAGEKYYALSTSRKNKLSYKNNLEELKEKYADHICMEGSYPKGYADAMGDYFIYSKWKKLEDGLEFDKKVREKN